MGVSDHPLRTGHPELRRGDRDLGRSADLSTAVLAFSFPCTVDCIGEVPSKAQDRLFGALRQPASGGMTTVSTHVLKSPVARLSNHRTGIQRHLRQDCPEVLARLTSQTRAMFRNSPPQWSRSCLFFRLAAVSPMYLHENCFAKMGQ
jgi:hypothetical protein